MARKCQPILGLNDSKPVWKIGVRVVDLWYVQGNPNQGHLEMIVMDEKGDKIQVGVKNEEFIHWSPKLKEHSTYVMQNLSIAPNKGKYKACEHQYKLSFTDCTTLKEMDIPAIPLFKYNFKKFSDINSRIYSEENLVDIIEGVDKIITAHPAGKLQKAVVALKDLSGDVVQCTLWEDLSKQFVTYLKQRTDPTGTIVFILTKAKIKEPQGKFLEEVSNSWDSSKLLINEECINIQNFKASFVPTETQQPSSQMMYAEIEPNFNQQFFDQLPATWCLVDENANIHEVDYNKSLQYPLITNGWEALRHFYGMTGNHMVYLGYMGDDLFKLRVISKPSEPASFPKFHSCCPCRPRPSFIHPLSNLNVIASYLDLPQELATHVRNAEYENLLLFGPTGAQTDCKVLIRDGNKKSTKIGKGWKTFCTEHNLKSGDVLRFVFVNPEGNNAVKVEKV